MSSLTIELPDEYVRLHDESDVFRDSLREQLPRLIERLALEAAVRDAVSEATEAHDDSRS